MTVVDDSNLDLSQEELKSISQLLHEAVFIDSSKKIDEKLDKSRYVLLDKISKMIVSVCDHDYQYQGTDGHGSHKGEDCYRCSKCHLSEYRY